jgi:hypothetical protein
MTASNTNKQKAVIYSRVSPDALREDGKGFRAQIIPCVEYANEQAYEILGTFVDFNIDGPLDRLCIHSGLIDMLNCLKDNEAAKVILLIANISILADDPKDHLFIRSLIDAASGTVEVPHIGPLTPYVRTDVFDWENWMKLER